MSEFTGNDCVFAPYAVRNLPIMLPVRAVTFIIVADQEALSWDLSRQAPLSKSAFPTTKNVPDAVDHVACSNSGNAERMPDVRFFDPGGAENFDLAEGRGRYAILRNNQQL